MIPPWVDQHPDVFSDPEFSITQLGKGSPNSFMDSLNVASSKSEQAGKEEKRGEEGEGEVGEEEEEEGEWEEVMGEVERGKKGEAPGIPDDPSLAETHYSQVCNV